MRARGRESGVAADAVPLWWADAPRFEAPDIHAPPPARADVVVVGSGNTGLGAALALARAGCRTVVLERHDIGWGASSRAGGMLGDIVKPGFTALETRFGTARAVAMMREGRAALAGILALIEGEGIDCDLQRTGRFTGAMEPAHLDTMRREIDALSRHFEIDATIVTREGQRDHVGSDLFHGGRFVPGHAAVNPAKLTLGLARLAAARGTAFRARCPVLEVERRAGRWVVGTTRGTIEADAVIVATNGYTDGAFPDHARWVVPAASHIVATEPVSPNLMAQLLPGLRMVTDTRAVPSYFRASPDGTRIYFGGRAGSERADPGRVGARLARRLVATFPELRGTRIEAAWSGIFALSLAPVPQIGGQHGLYHALCYSGSGLSMSVHLGGKAAAKALGLEEGRTAFDGVVAPVPFLHPLKKLGVRLAIARRSLSDLLGSSPAGAG